MMDIPRYRNVPYFRLQHSGIVITAVVDGVIQVLYAEEYQRPDYNEMLHTVIELIRKYHIEKIYIDGANPSFIRSLKIGLDEDPEYERTIARYKSHGFRNWEDSAWMKVVPVNFHTRHKEMLGHTKMLLERGNIAINPKFDKLVISLKTAVDTDGTLDKEATSYNDIFDAYRLVLQNYTYPSD
jgi:hypothetical protein